jgi:hypothetical protein
MGGEEAVAHSYRASPLLTAGEADASARHGNSAFEPGAHTVVAVLAPQAEFQQVLGRHSPLGSPPHCM